MGVTNFPHGISSYGQIVNGRNAPAMGKEYHVRKEADANYASWYDQLYMQHYDGSVNIHTTIEGAVAVADDFDTIWVYPGQWKPTATLNITQEHLSLLAVQTGPGHAFTRTEIRQHGNSAVPIITCNAHAFELAGFRLTPYSDDSYEALLIGSTANVYGAYIHDNYFYAVEIGNMAQAITLGESGETYAVDSCCIFNNRFYAGGTSAISGTPAPTALGIIQIWNAPRFNIHGNQFDQYTNHADNYAINMNDTGNGIRGTITDNRFFASELTVDQCVCVAIKNPTATGGDCYIDGNVFINYAGDDNCVASNTDECLGINYNNATAVAAG